MFKLIALYKEPAPEDKAAFEEHYFNVHLPLCDRLPGLVRAEVSRFSGAVGGPAPYYLMAELVFNSKEEHDAAFATPEGKAVGRDTRNFPPGILTIAYAQTV